MKENEFAIVCLDGFSPSLTVTSMVNEEGGTRFGIVGHGSVADLVVCVAGMCSSVLKSGLMTKSQIMSACLSGLLYAEANEEENGDEGDENDDEQ